MDALPVVQESMNKYVGDQKKKIDRAYVAWCCKSSRPLSMGETDKHFRKFMISATQGKYIPCSKKTAMEELITLVTLSRQLTRASLHRHLEEECLDIAISGVSTILVVYFTTFEISCLSQAIFGVKMEYLFSQSLDTGSTKIGK